MLKYHWREKVGPKLKKKRKKLKEQENHDHSFCFNGKRERRQNIILYLDKGDLGSLRVSL